MLLCLSCLCAFNWCQTVELRGYSRVGDNTYPNVMALLLGKLANERPPGALDLAPMLWLPFAEAGYRTLFVEDAYIGNHIFNIWIDNQNSPGGFKKAPTDYYFRTMSVAQYNDEKSEAFSRWYYGPLCIGPTFETELLLNWVSCHRDKNFNTHLSAGYFPYGGGIP